MLQWTSTRNRFRRGRYVLHEHPLEASSWLDLRVISLQKRKGVFTASSLVCCFQAKIETKDGSRNVNSFVCKSTKWMTNSKPLAEASEKRCSDSNEPPFSQTHRVEWRIGQNGQYAPELVNTVLRGLRQQMLDDGWICELELEFAGHRRANRFLISKMSQPRSGWMNSTISQVHSFQGILYTQERWKKFVG